MKNFKSITIILLLLMLSVTAAAAQKSPKREFRGAWIQCVNGQFQGLGKERMQSMLSQQLDDLRRDGVNAIIFQVRPECDALYKSDIEPWSRFLTGEQGQAPSPYWDPLDWMIKECHMRGMELHAWINPYRAKTKGTTRLADNHIVMQHPERAFSYDNQFILNPGIPENRDYICRVAIDIVMRYDIDGFHIDDYFYPYPVAGMQILDNAEYQKYNVGFKNVADWRRNNVSLFVKQLSETIHMVKPWVKFGISPFGIYHNEGKGNIPGSKTKGLQNYDDLYADILLWINNGWLDYCVPQIYWQIGHPTADYKTLIQWWDKNASKRHLYIGEDVERTIKYADVDNPGNNQMYAKYRLRRINHNVSGAVLWYAKAVTDNVGDYGTLLREYYWPNIALPPTMPYLDDKAPGKVKKMAVISTEDGPVLFWQAPKAKKWGDQTVRYVVYRFNKGDKIDLEDASKIVKVTPDTFYNMTQSEKNGGYTFVVTALDRLSNESKGVKKIVK